MGAVLGHHRSGNRPSLRLVSGANRGLHGDVRRPRGNGEPARYQLFPGIPRMASPRGRRTSPRSEEHTSELQSPCNLVCRLLLEKKKKVIKQWRTTTIN